MISIIAPRYVPFESRTEEQRALRATLRREWSDLRAGSGEMLWASLSGELPAGADVENALFYNLDSKGAFANSMGIGVCFEHDPQPFAAGVRYRYDVVPVNAAFRSWTAVRELATFDAQLEASPTLASIWWALRSGDDVIRPLGVQRQPSEPFSITLDIEAPIERLRPGLIKTLLDGIISGLQSQTDQAMAAVLAPRIAEAIPATAQAVLAALTDSAPSVLGIRDKLVNGHGSGVNGHPTTTTASRLAYFFVVRPTGDWQAGCR